MSWVATAVIGGAVIGGVASNSASKRAVEGQEDAREAMALAAEQARTRDIIPGFQQAQEQQDRGFTQALDFLSQAPQQQITPFQQGNIAAQNQLAGGLPQIQNALLGLPVDFSGFQAQQIGQPNQFNFDLSRFAQPDPATITPSGGGGRFGDAVNNTRPDVNRTTTTRRGKGRSVISPTVRGINISR